MEIWEYLCLDLEVLPDFGYANYFPSLSAVSETWNNKVLEIMLQAFSFYRSENQVLLQTHGGPLLAVSSCLPVFMGGGQRRKEAAGTGQNASFLSFLPSSPSSLPEAVFPGWQSRAGCREGSAGRGACRAEADTSDKSNLFPGRRLDGN